MGENPYTRRRGNTYIEGIVAAARRRRVSEARFGLDLVNGAAPPLGSTPADPEDDWDNLSWAHFPSIKEGQYVNAAAPLGATASLKPKWTDSASIASILLQKPV